MRQDAARSIHQQLNRPDSSGAAGFKLGSNIELRNALYNWENENDPLAVVMRNRMSRASRENPQNSDTTEHTERPVERPVAQAKRVHKNCSNKYREKIAAMTPEELAALKSRQKEVNKLRSERLLQERIAFMTPEELQIFRKQSERMKKFRAELKERKAQLPP